MKGINLVLFLPIAIIVSLFPVYANAGIEDNLTNDDPLKSSILQIEDELLKILKRPQLNSSNQISMTDYIFSIKEGYKIKENTISTDVFLTQLANISTYRNHEMYGTGFVQDPNVVVLLAIGLSDKRERNRKVAYHLIMNNVKQKDIQNNSSLIQKSLNKFNSSEAMRLEALLNLEERRKLALLNARKIDIDVKARLGDKGAMNEIVNRFNDTNDFDSKVKYINKLGYIGGDESARVLARNLNSDLIYKAAYSDVSLKCYIIQALGRIYPDNSLFTSEINKIIKIGDDVYGVNNIQNYLKAITSFLENELKIKIEPISSPLIYKRYIRKIR